MPKSYEKTRLWQDSFGGSKPEDEATTRLARIYSDAWERACSLAKRIATDAEGLTLHDEAHFTRLWECADMIAGNNYSLHPIETFIFGVAILIHDSAHTILAFEGGIEALSKTPEWKDALVSKAQHDENLGHEPSAVPQALRKSVLFETLRTLHARQARTVLFAPFKHPSLGHNFYLIDDPTIRGHFGSLIGEIAASHHWSISKLEALGRQRNPIPPYHAHGPIRPIVLGALLRTADAIQIDAGRAPDFEFALTQPQGVSYEHWTAQNRLSIAPDVQDHSALVVTSSVPFGEKHAKAWWTAFDLANVADRELRAVDQILRDASFPSFEITRVKDISDPERFSNHVQTNGWIPISAEVKINDTGKIVEMFGGRGLYGDDSTVPLRELIQNAADAVRARRILESEFAGKVTVSLRRGQNEEGQEGYWLCVADNGIGMSSAVLTGPFLAFGECGWSSSVIREERPGLFASRFKRTGRFGIGFFSVFMVSNEISITTRSFDAALSDAKTLSFNSGLALRPIVKAAPAKLGMTISTAVELFIPPEIKDKILRKANAGRVYEGGQLREKPASFFTLHDLVGMLCPAIDVEIEVRHDEEVHSILADWQTEDAEQWLFRINAIKSEDLPDAVGKNLGLLDMITLDSGEVVGRASLNPTENRLCVFAIGGLGEKKSESFDHGRHFVGYLDVSPRGPSRNFGEVHSKKAVARWAQNQVEMWLKADIDGRERNFIAANAAYFGGDPMKIANCMIDGQWSSLAEVFETLLVGELIAPIAPVNSHEEQWRVMGTVNFSSGFLLDPKDIEVTQKNVMLAGPTADIHAYWAIPVDDDNAQFSFIGCLARYACLRERCLAVTGDRVDFGLYNGENSRLQQIKTGDRLVLPGIRLSLENNPIGK